MHFFKRILPFLALLAFVPFALTEAEGANGKTTAAKTTQKSSKGNERIKKLQNEQTQVKRTVRKIDNKLSANRKTVRQKLQQIEQLNEDIRHRNAVIDSQTVAISNLSARIDTMNDDILNMEMEFNVAKRKYVELVYRAYQKNSVYDRLLYLFSANSIQQSYMRFQYIREFAKMRRRQAADINDTRAELVESRKELERTKKESEALLASREREKRNVIKEKQEQKQLVASLRKESSELREQLRQQQRMANRLNQKIQDLVAAEAAKNAGKKSSSKQTASSKSSSANNNKQKNSTNKVAASTDDASVSFEKQKGNMHWPVRRGSIAQHFGRHQHPVLNVVVDNKGVYITSPAGSEALAVAQGEVTNIFSIPGNNSAVIVRHGKFLTVYANLTSIFVSVGQKVKQGDKMGRIYTDPDNNTASSLFFQLYKEKNILNPESWLRPLK